MERFICDRMLGRLARWLRLMGVDVDYPGEMDDSALLERALSTGRILLTRDRELARRAGRMGLLIESLDLALQIEEFMRRFGMGEHWFERCPICNGLLVGCEATGVMGSVPEGVLHRYDLFWRCTSCGQKYWPGSQYMAIERRLKEIQPKADHVGDILT